MQKQLSGGKFYKQKGKVYKIAANDDKYAEWAFQGNVKILTGPAKDTKINIDQIHLEPVLPNIPSDGSKPDVIILKGKYKGQVAALTELDESNQ